MGKIIGFIGQGWIGKNYADDFEKRGYETVRYSLEKPYVDNKEKIKDCDLVFIAVPTPTTPTLANFNRAALPCPYSRSMPLNLGSEIIRPL